MSGIPAIVIGHGKLRILTCSKCIKDCHELAIERHAQLKEARAEIERLTQARDMWRRDYEALQSEQGKAMISYVVRESEYKKLIEQMRVALTWLYQWTKNEVEHFGAASPDEDIAKDVEAALSAAERGE